MKLTVSTLVSLFIYFLSYSQNLSWHYLYSQNGGGNSRYTDVFFTNKSIGFTSGNNILKTIDGGKTWTAKTNFSNNGGYHHLRSIEFLEDHVTGIAGTLSSQVYRTDDAGETWQDISLNIHDTVDTIGAKGICGLAHVGDNFYGVGAVYTQIARFYKSTDKGLTWTVKAMDTNLATQLVDVFFVSEDTGFVSGSKGGSYGVEESVVLKTTDGGSTWTKVFSDVTIGGRIWKLHFLDNQIAFGSIEPRFYPDTVTIIRTDDGGNNWKILSIGNIKSPEHIGTQSVGFINPMKGWVGGWYPGMFETNDGGNTWTYLNFGRNVNRFFMLDSNDMVACGLGIYRFGDTSKFTSIGKDHDKPAILNLSPIYPNPTDGVINIEFEIGFATNILLQVVSLDAKRSYTVLNKVHMPGKYKYTWDGSHLPNGNYLIWLDNDLAPITQKFMINKQ